MQKKNMPIHQEVLGYLDMGIEVSLNGKSIESCDRGIYSIKENSCYMREYTKGPDGDLKNINFTMIKKM